MKRSRSYLQEEFKTGKKPSQDDFYDLFDSFYHKDEDPIGISGWTSYRFLNDTQYYFQEGGIMSFNIPLGVSEIINLRIVGGIWNFSDDVINVPISVNLFYFSDTEDDIIAPIPPDYPGGLFKHPICNNNPEFIEVEVSPPNIGYDQVFGINHMLNFLQIHHLTLELEIVAFPQQITIDSIIFGIEYR